MVTQPSQFQANDIFETLKPLPNETSHAKNEMRVRTIPAYEKNRIKHNKLEIPRREQCLGALLARSGATAAADL